MKKAFLVLALSSLCLMINAQNRLPELPKSRGYTDFSIQERGFWNAIEANIESSVIFNHGNTQRSGLNYTAGYRFSEFIKIGIGLGVNWYFHGNGTVRPGKEELVLPLSINARGNFFSHYSREIVPYWSLAAGYAFGDGAFFSPCVGLRFGSIRGAWLLGLNYTIAKVKVDEDILNPHISFIGIKAGYEF